MTLSPCDLETFIASLKINFWTCLKILVSCYQGQADEGGSLKVLSGEKITFLRWLLQCLNRFNQKPGNYQFLTSKALITPFVKWNRVYFPMHFHNFSNTLTTDKIYQTWQELQMVSSVGLVVAAGLGWVANKAHKACGFPNDYKTLLTAMGGRRALQRCCFSTFFNITTPAWHLDRMHFHFSLSTFFASILTFFQMFSSGHFLPFHQLHKYCLLSLSILQSRSPLPPIHAHSHSVLI